MEKDEDNNPYTENTSDENPSSSTSTHILEYIYDDEILPEIEIREVISIDTFLKENPKFVALSDETILILLKQFYTNNAKAKGFFDLHKSVIADKNVDILTSIFVHIDAIRKDNEDITKYFQEKERAMNAPSFELQQLELNKIAYPFEPEQTLQPNQFILDEPSHIVLTNSEDKPFTPADISKTLLIDDIKLPVLGAYWKAIAVYKLLYLNETNTAEDFIYTQWKPEKPAPTAASAPSAPPEQSEVPAPSEELTLDEWFRNFIQPSFKKTVHKIISLDDLRSYGLILGKAGYDINNLSKYQDKLLRKHLQKISSEADADTDEITPDKKNSATTGIFPKIETIYPSLTFLESIQRHKDRYLAYFQEERFYRVQENLGSYIASLPNFQNEIESYDPYIFATQIVQGTHTLEDLKQIITQLNIRANFNRANLLLKKMSASKAYLPLSKWSDIYNKIYNSINDDKHNPFISLYNDISEVKRGNDTSKYDGTPNVVFQNVYEESQYEVIVPGINDTDKDADISPEEEVYDSIPDNLNETFPALNDAHDGIKDIMKYVIPFLIKIRDASALPWDINSWVKLYGIEVQKQSRANKLIQHIETINPFIVHRICGNSLEISLQLINELNTVDIANKLREVYPKIFADWKADCKDAIFHALTIWLLDILELSVNGTLDFSILNGMLNFAEIWSPYGPPLIEKRAASGVIYYISAIAALILPYDNIQPNAIEERILDIATKKYASRIEILKQAWNKVKDKQERQDKATQAKQDLQEATRKLLAKEKINFLPTYVKAYYYLPTFIPKKDMQAFKKQPIWAQGCCLSRLDKTYEADNDWKGHIKPLWSMKNKLAEDRWLTSPREELTIFRNTDKQDKPDKQTKADKQAKADKHAKADKKAPEEHENEKRYFEKQASCFIKSKKDVLQQQIIFQPNDIWIQKSHYDILYREAREGSSTLIKQCIQGSYQRVKADKILTIIETLFQLNDIYHILLKIIHSTITKIEAVNEGSQEYLILQNTKEILYDMKNILNMFLKATGTEYTACVYRARYILARALCLPGMPHNNKMTTPDNVSAIFYSNILKDNYTIITQWTKNNTMLTQSEIQAYITKMREEQKKTTLNKLDVLSVDDMQLMKDVKRFGLMKTLEKTNNKQAQEETPSANNTETPSSNDTDDIGINVEVNEDQEGESEWLQPSTDQDVNDEDTLESIL